MPISGTRSYGSGLTPAEKARIALFRFGLGPKPDLSPSFWTDPSVVDAAIEEELSPGATTINDPLLLNDVEAGGLPSFGSGAEYLLFERRVRYQQHMRPTLGLAERLVLFWMNYFSIVISGPVATHGAGPMERQVIRRNTFRRFGTMLAAMCQNPVMLWYLNGRDSTAKYMNQNYAREILELYTLGSAHDDETGRVANYEQSDVEALAAALTGWDTARNATDRKDAVDVKYLLHSPVPGGFAYRPNNHVTGDKTILNLSFRDYPGRDGVQQGIDILRYLARHRHTAENIARRMAVHFISDTPSASLVGAIADSFKANNGDLRATTIAMLTHEDSWARPVNRIRQPYSWFISMLRALNLPLERLDVVCHSRFDSSGNPVMRKDGSEDSFIFQNIFENWMSPTGQFPGAWKTPDGYPDQADYWMNGNALRVRLNVSIDFITDITNKKYPVGYNRRKAPMPGLPVPPPLQPATPWQVPDPSQLMTQLFGDAISPETRAAVTSLATTNKIHALGLLFNSREFILR